MSAQTSLHPVPMAGREPEGDPASQATNTAPRGHALPEVDEHLVSLCSPRSFEADQYRILRHFLDQAKGSAARQVLGITSPTAGDGKTTTAVNLAATLAQLPGARVLLVDADLRRPFVAVRLGLDEEDAPGLAATAVDPDLELDQVVRRTPFHFDIVPAGASSPNAYRVFDSPRVGQLLEQARRKYDHVVLDTPPVLLVPDCRLISQWVDGFVFVVAAHRTPRKLVADALGAITEEKIVGIVFNGDDRPLSGYYKRYQGHYGYYRDPSAHAPRRWWPLPWRRAEQGSPRR
jgi:capsular exopolysaccharide synthesis family protein